MARNQQLLAFGPHVTTVAVAAGFTGVSEVLIEGTKMRDLLANLCKAKAEPGLLPAFLLLSASIFNL
ncbi:unnamed protein product [Bubo scandiacus]